MKTKILVICHGNICRSPAAQKILQKKIPELTVKSAGMKINSSGKLIAAKMRIALEARGYSSDGRSIAISAELIEWAELILYMNESNRINLCKYDVDLEKIQCIAHLVGLQSIPDPNFSRIEKHYEVIDLLEQAFSSQKFGEWLK